MHSDWIQRLLGLPQTGLKTFPGSQSAADAEHKRNVGFKTQALKEMFSEV